MNKFYFCILVFLIFSSHSFAQKDSSTVKQLSEIEKAPIVFLKGNVIYNVSYSFLKYKGYAVAFEKERAISDKTGFVTTFGKYKSIYKYDYLRFSDEKCGISFGLRHHMGNKLKNKIFDFAPSIYGTYLFRKTENYKFKEVIERNVVFNIGADFRLYLSENVGISFGTGLNLRNYENLGFRIGVVVKK